MGHQAMIFDTTPAPWLAEVRRKCILQRRFRLRWHRFVKRRHEVGFFISGLP
jgi:hypothetical protein